MEVSDLLLWISGAMALVFGGGGLAALLRVRHDRKLGIAQQETAEDDAIAKRWQEIVKTQTEALVAPLQTRVANMEEKLSKVQAELETSRKKYWSAISHIRILYTWISRHMPDDVDATQIPEPPATLAEDI